MPNYSIILGILLCIQPWCVSANSLQETMRLAQQQHPMLKISQMHIETANAVLTEQRAYAYNPEFSIEPQRRNLKGGGTSNDYYLGLSQSIETAGKQAYRTASSASALKAVQLEQDIQRQRIVFDAARAYVHVVFSQRVLRWRQHQLATLKKLKTSIVRQQELGEMNQLDVNLAQASLTQAMHAEVQAKQNKERSLSNYFLAIGSEHTFKVPTLRLPQLSVHAWLDQEAIQLALTSRPELRALAERVQQYSHQAELAQAQRTPDMTVGLAAGREAGEQIYSVSLSMPIPVLNTHDGAYRAALAQVMLKRAELRWMKQRVQLEVIEAQRQYQLATQASIAVNQMQNTFDGQINLAQKAFEAGELDTEELVLHITQILESRINIENISQQRWLARIRFAETLGKSAYVYQNNAY